MTNKLTAQKKCPTTMPVDGRQIVKTVLLPRENAASLAADWPRRQKTVNRPVSRTLSMYLVLNVSLIMIS